MRDATGVSVLVEPMRGPSGASETIEAKPPPLEPFRTGLSDLDLGLTADERREFERLDSRGAAPGDEIRPRGDNF